MTSAELARVIDDDIRVRVEESVRDLRDYCAAHGEPLTKHQLFAVCSLPLRLTLGLEESMTNIVDTYDAIRAVLPDLPAWNSEEALQAWLKDPGTTGRLQ